MGIDTGAAQEAAVSLFHNLGPLDDLPEELRNTLANVYYRFFALSRNLQDPSKVLGYDNSDAMSTFKGFTEGLAEVQAAFRTAKGMVRALREVRNERSDLYEYLVVLTLDFLKYRIPDADQMTPVRRAIERKLRKPPSEIDGLYDHMELWRRREEGKPKRASCVPSEPRLPFPKGAQVEHTTFGHGSVLYRNKEKIVISFDKFGVKSFVASIVLPNLKKSDRDAEAIAKTQ